MFYAGDEEFVERATSFVREGVQAGESVLVAVVAPKGEMIRSALGRVVEKVVFVDMRQAGRNPARIIPLWREFIDRHGTPGRRVRGIGEPVWAARTPEELVESQRHEALLNLAFAGDPAWILCPYDTASLRPSILEEAQRTHPIVSRGGVAEASAACLHVDEWAAPFDRPLAERPGEARSLLVSEASLAEIRAIVYEEASKSGLGRSRAEDLVIAVNEVCTNSIRHAGGSGRLKIWNAGSCVVCEVHDEAQISQPLVGRERPRAGQEGGFGLWLVNQLCDLVQIRSFPAGSVVRLHMRVP